MFYILYDWVSMDLRTNLRESWHMLKYCEGIFEKEILVSHSNKCYMFFLTIYVLETIWKNRLNVGPQILVQVLGSQ